VEGEMNGKEEEALSLVKREKDIDARVVWIDAEYKRREVRLKLAAVNQEKTTIESQRNILDNSIKRLKTALDEAEKNERRLGELKRSLAVKMPLTVAEEEKLAGERFDIEKQMHDIELRRWNIEDEYKTASELFSKQDMAYLDVTHRVEVLESELKSFGM
jgi:chromosome segregation ATPase